MVSHRLERLNDLLRSTIADILSRDIKDPRIGFVTITRVSVSKDLKHAKVYVSHIGNQEEIIQSLQALQHAAKFIQSEAGHKIRIKYTPKLLFLADQNIEYSIKINKLLEKLKDDHDK